MSEFLNLLLTAGVVVGLVTSFSDLVVRRWEASGWSALIAFCGTVAILAHHFPEAVLR